MHIPKLLLLFYCSIPVIENYSINHIKNIYINPNECIDFAVLLPAT